MIRFLAARFDLFIQARAWWLIAALCALFVLAYPFSGLFPIAKISLTVFGFVAATDFVLLFLSGRPLTVHRHTGEKWSLGDENIVRLDFKNNAPMVWRCLVIDELPFELQERNFELKINLGPYEDDQLKYHVRPVKRGHYEFGMVRVIIRTPIGLFGRRLSTTEKTGVSVYPSIIQMKKYNLFTVNRLAKFYGVKRMRRIGMSYEFEQIKDYVQGDDIRHINWKATGRSNGLKTNHFIEERAQPVYTIIDKSRPMNLAFDGLTLLDYAINASLIISNTALQKGDKAGLITFSDRLGSAVRADHAPGQLRRIMDSLYAEKYRSTEADYEFLYNAVKRITSSRSLLIMFSNFESSYALQRVLPILRKLNMQHLLVVVFFTNSEVEDYAYETSANMSEIYKRMVARQMVADKRQMAIELGNHGIQTVVCKPQELNISVLNKYIELKAKGMI